MGACVSHHHHNHNNLNASSMKVQQVSSFETCTSNKVDQKLVFRSSTSSDGKLITVMDGHIAVKPQLPPQSHATFSDYGMIFLLYNF